MTLDAVPLLRGAALLRSWTRCVTIGEAAGFAVPAAVGVLSAGSAAVVYIPALLMAGAVEGAVLGVAQAHVLRRALPGLQVHRWVTSTSAAAVFAYTMGADALHDRFRLTSACFDRHGSGGRNLAAAINRSGAMVGAA